MSTMLLFKASAYRAINVETDLMEWDDNKILNCDTPVKIKFKPFEIKTFKVKMGKC